MSLNRDLEQATRLLSFDSEDDSCKPSARCKLKPMWTVFRYATSKILYPTTEMPKRLYHALLRLHSPDSNSSSQNASDTVDHLTGLRGAAAIIVFVYHLAHGPYRSAMEHAYGASPSSANRHLLQLPLLRVVYAAEASVALFFVLSGYTLARRPIAAMAAGDAAKAAHVLASLAFRRAMRLFMPAVASSFLALCAFRIGWVSPRGLPGDYVASLGNDLGLYLAFLGSLLDVSTWEIDIDKGMWWFNAHLWTVPVEFRCSMVLFLLAFATHRCKPGVRILIDAVWIMTALVYWRWDVALFITGKGMAELQSLHIKILHSCHGLRFARLATAFVICFLGLYLASYPILPPDDSFFFSQLAALVHQKPEGRRLYYALAGVLILCSIEVESLLRRPFKIRLLKYFGRISFSLYLTHGTLIRVAGGGMLNFFWRMIGYEEWRFHVAFAVGSVVFTPLAVVVAELFYQLVESPCIRFSKWMEDMCGVK